MDERAADRIEQTADRDVEHGRDQIGLGHQVDVENDRDQRQRQRKPARQPEFLVDPLKKRLDFHGGFLPNLLRKYN